MKICSKCKIEKNLDQYGKKSRNKDGLSYSCKDCVSLENKYYKEKNREINNAKSKEYYCNNKEYFKKKSKEYYQINKEKFVISNSVYYLNNKKYFSEKAKKYRENNKDNIHEYNKEYMKKYYTNFENRLKRSKYVKIKKEVDPIYKLNTVVRSLINYSIKSKKYDKKNKTLEILGCSFEEFTRYIESKFEKWMNWDNHGRYNGELNYGWDLDHIIPISNAKNEEDVILLNHYTNFQPLCSYINRYVKKNRLDYK